MNPTHLDSVTGLSTSALRPTNRPAREKLRRRDKILQIGLAGHQGLQPAVDVDIGHCVKVSSFFLFSSLRLASDWGSRCIASLRDFLHASHFKLR